MDLAFIVRLEQVRLTYLNNFFEFMNFVCLSSLGKIPYTCVKVPIGVLTGEES
jgi:hypothetical protein